MISVIMGVYNEVNSISMALDSIKKQTIKDIELVVCDDCSTDGSWELLLKMKDTYNIDILLRNDVNSGLAYSLNRCIEYSHGEFIARMDADDWCKPERLEKQLNILKTHKEYDLVGTLCMFVYNNGTEREFNKPEVPTKNILPLTNPFIHPTVMIRRSSLEKLGRYNVSERTRHCEDLDLWYRFFETGLKGHNIQEYLYFKRQSLKSYRKRNLKYGIDVFIVHVKGIRLLKMKWYKYVLALKPICSVLIPTAIKRLYQENKR